MWIWPESQKQNHNTFDLTQPKYQHGDSSVLQLRLAAALEVLDASVGREPGILVWNGWEPYLVLTPSIRSFSSFCFLVRQSSHQETLRGPRNQLDPERRARSQTPGSLVRSLLN